MRRHFCAKPFFRATAIGIATTMLVTQVTGCGKVAISDALNATAGCFSAPVVVFSSSKALDGSDGSNTYSNVWAMTLDGSQQVLTKFSPASATASAVSNDGKRLVFLSNVALDGSGFPDPSGISNIWIMNTDGTGGGPLTRLTAIAAFLTGPKFSPDGTRVIYASNRALDGSDSLAGTSNIWSINVDGSGNTPLTSLTASSADSINATFSPDGTKIVYESQRALGGTNAANTNARRNIWIMNANGSGATPLTSITAATAANSFYGTFSPDGTKIAYQSQRALNGSDAANTNSTSNIWIMNNDGTGNTALTSLTASGADTFVPSFNPAGNKLVYYSSRRVNGTDNADSARNVWVINTDGSGSAALTSLVTTYVHSSDPKFTADGGSVIYRSRRALSGADAANSNFTYNIWSMNADGSGSTALTKITAAAADSGNHFLAPACH